MQRPEILVIVMASVDGKLATAPGRNVTEWTALGFDGGAHEVANRLCDALDCDGMISGSGSLLVYRSHPVELDQSLYWPKKSKAFIVIDGRGRVEWAQSDGLLVVTREDVSQAYVEQLEKKGIDYIQCSREIPSWIAYPVGNLWNEGFRMTSRSQVV